METIVLFEIAAQTPDFEAVFKNTTTTEVLLLTTRLGVSFTWLLIQPTGYNNVCNNP
jgi:hypothetical protein